MRMWSECDSSKWSRWAEGGMVKIIPSGSNVYQLVRIGVRRQVCSRQPGSRPKESYLFRPGFHREQWGKRKKKSHWWRPGRGGQADPDCYFESWLQKSLAF